MFEKWLLQPSACLINLVTVNLVKGVEDTMITKSVKVIIAISVNVGKDILNYANISKTTEDVSLIPVLNDMRKIHQKLVMKWRKED